MPTEQDAPQPEGLCSVCGHVGPFVVLDVPVRENFRCSQCGASMRYRLQASVLVRLYGPQARTLKGLAMGGALSGMDVYEPGIIGELRRHLEGARTYTKSYLWEDVSRGHERDGVRSEDLEQLTFADRSFDLVVSSDIFEHVRRPWTAFAEVLRVLRPGGAHVFTVPLTWPLRHETVSRVDTSDTADLLLMSPVYHGSPVDPRGSLVYTDFGLDLPERLRAIGYETSVHFGYRHNAVVVAERPR